MRKRKPVEAWVVYKMAIRGGAAGPNSVCSKAEWDAMQRADPGRHALVLSGIASEGRAEKLAREAPGGTAPGKKVRLRTR